MALVTLAYISDRRLVAADKFSKEKKFKQTKSTKPVSRFLDKAVERTVQSM